MRVTIKGLRRWIIATAALLLAVVAGFFVYGRSRFRHIEKDLPGRLGINIQQTATAFSYSQSSQGHTLFTLKASKLIQLKAGHALLHDVDITLYGPPGSGRADRIYGNDFDYDQNAGIATSQGEVTIELGGMNASAPPAAGGGAPPAASASPSPSADSSGAPTPGGSGADTIRVRTRGITFEQKTGEASTQQGVEFQLPRGAGSSVGANYNSKTGVLILDSQVHLTTSSNGKSAVIDAQHATLLRATMQADLTAATMEYETEKSSADAATVYFRKDGTTERVDGHGHVHIATDSGATVNASTAQILLDPKSQPTRADLGGGVVFASEGDNDVMHGNAAEGTLLFTAVPVPGKSPQTALTHGQFRRSVNFTEQITGLPRDPHGRADKELSGDKVDVDFAPPVPGKGLEARKAWGEGQPVVTEHQFPSKGPQTTTRISGDHLVALLGPGNTLQTLDGKGHTRVLDDSSDGARDTSQGDVLHATFEQAPAPAPKTAPGKAAAAVTTSGPSKAKPAAPKMATTLATAIQDGNVMLTETPARKPGAATQPATLTSWAQHAEYHASDQVLALTGSPRITDSQSMQMSAEQIDYHRDTQDASGRGNVKATYTQQQKPPASASARTQPPTMGGNGPVHIIAERAEMHHASNESYFYGAKTPARMWQDADSLIAPVIEIDRDRNLLKAWGENTGDQPVVDANFTSAVGAGHQQTVVQVHSQTLVYSDKERRADFHGTVTAVQAGQVIHSDDALVFLKPAQGPARPGVTNPPATGAPKAQGLDGQSSQIDHMIAIGHVVFTQPGRRGEGEKLVYTADNGEYVLTGTPAAPPRLTDRVHGTTTGVALLFNSQNDSVEVSGGKSSAVTDTRAPK